MAISWLAVLGWLSMSGCLWGNNAVQDGQQDTDKAKQVQTDEGKKLETITLGGGCFWCTEAVFLQVKGVEKVVSGYMGGKTVNPTYKQICTGQTGHAEVIQVHYDPKVVRVERILEIFWGTHDPTTLNRQGADIGTQYRSAVFFHQDSQREVAETLIKKLEEAKVFDDPIVTEVTAASSFYPAEDYHQNYYSLNSSQGYCQAVIKPKLDKLKKVFAEHLKSND